MIGKGGGTFVGAAFAGADIWWPSAGDRGRFAPE